MIKSYIQHIEHYFPQNQEFNSLDDKLTAKIGIKARHISSIEESASDLAINAAINLFNRKGINRKIVDYIIFCTQSPDYFMPTSACIIQQRLGLTTSCGALDINLGCSGYVYGLSLAKGLIETNLAKNILLLTGDTYSKYINSKDRSVRVLFGDGATATLISGIEAEEDYIGPFVFGTDGSGADNLIVPAGGSKEPITSESFIEHEDPYGNIRSRVNLYMNGPEIFNFTLREIPPTIDKLLSCSGRTKNDYDYFVFHQANKYMLEHLRRKLGIEVEKFPVTMEKCGNTVSSSIPLVLEDLITEDKLKSGHSIMLVGFGVGYSWAACNIKWIEN